MAIPPNLSQYRPYVVCLIAGLITPRDRLPLIKCKAATMRYDRTIDLMISFKFCHGAKVEAAKGHYDGYYH